MHPYIEEKEEIILDNEEMMEMEMEMRSSWNERVRRMASGNAVVVFSLSGCCMCHVVKTLLHGLGVGPTVYELDLLENGGEEIKAVLFQLLLTTPNSSSSPGGASPRRMHSFLFCFLWFELLSIFCCSLLKETMRLLFQPAEEGGAGAFHMIKDCALDGVDAIFGNM
ncbi:hypothetical protein J5N97_000195 [Dioscorea zingiberensis]|uniref:Glutaredoxin domain-containing protein n=1 Tax=Dioscorea zingiberensis TaxID=325984 RepID=A0A9D5BVI1_9LILI|nr:hypothetical protein J5N97_000195 [Dioscorea zingiberensis]